MQQSSQVAPSAAAHRAPGTIPGSVPADPRSAELAAVAAPGAASIVIDRNLLLQGIALQNEGKLEQAQAVFELFLTHIPNEGVALYSLAVVLMERFGAERALPVVERGVQVASGFAPIWYAAGAVQQRLGLLELALVLQRDALQQQVLVDDDPLADRGRRRGAGRQRADGHAGNARGSDGGRDLAGLLHSAAPGKTL